MQRKHALRKRMRSGEAVVGVMLPLPCPGLVEILGYAGADFVTLDAEHGAFGIPQIEHMLRAADVVDLPVIVRVPDHDHVFIGQVLDCGATGVQIPHVRSDRDAERIVEALRFTPLGRRGLGPVRASAYTNMETLAFVEKAHAETVSVAQIEDADAVSAIDSILSVKGVDVAFIGRHDLAASLGVTGQLDHPIVKEHVERVVRACDDHGVVLGFSTNVSEGTTLLQRGARFLSLSFVPHTLQSWKSMLGHLASGIGGDRGGR